MSIRVASDRETDRLLSLRASANLPLPPEIALADPRESDGYFRRATFYAAYGLDDHPMVKLLEGRSVATMMSKALSRAQHLDRISHYAAWLGHQPVRIIDLTQPPQGRAGPARRRAPPVSKEHRRHGGSRAFLPPYPTMDCPNNWFR